MGEVGEVGFFGFFGFCCCCWVEWSGWEGRERGEAMRWLATAWRRGWSLLVRIACFGISHFSVGETLGFFFFVKEQEIFSAGGNEKEHTRQPVEDGRWAFFFFHKEEFGGLGIESERFMYRKKPLVMALLYTSSRWLDRRITCSLNNETLETHCSWQQW